MNRWMPWVTLIALLLGTMQTAPAENAPAGAQANPQTALQKMAFIMYRLKHFPDPKSKEVLQQIMVDPATSEREKNLAGAMVRLNHRALVEDKIKLKEIMEGEQASADERALASIIYNLDHRPTQADKNRLQEML